jgi:hypothetical protein
MNYARQEDKPFRMLAAFVALHSVESLEKCTAELSR